MWWFFLNGGAYSVDKEGILKIDEKEIIDYKIHQDMRKFINPILKIEGIFICPIYYNMWFKKVK